MGNDSTSLDVNLWVAETLTIFGQYVYDRLWFVGNIYEHSTNRLSYIWTIWSEWYMKVTYHWILWWTIFLMDIEIMVIYVQINSWWLLFKRKKEKKIELMKAKLICDDS